MRQRTLGSIPVLAGNVSVGPFDECEMFFFSFFPDAAGECWEISNMAVGTMYRVDDSEA